LNFEHSTLNIQLRNKNFLIRMINYKLIFKNWNMFVVKPVRAVENIKKNPSCSFCLQKGL